MNVYRRRRLVAAAVVTAAVAVPVYVALGRGGARDSTPSGPLVQPTLAAAPAAVPAAVPAQLRAVPPGRTLPRPTRTVGGGPFVTVAGPLLRRSEAPHGAGAVALTFDDGPGPQTEQILQTLVRLRAPATFFVLGSLVHDHPDVVRDERAAGMVVGNHTWTHPALTRLSPAAQRWQLRQTSRTIAQVVGGAPRFFRPPLWVWDAGTAREAAQQGMVTVLFSVDTLDYTRPGVAAIVRVAAHAPAGSVIALHDAGGDRTQTLRALPLIVHGLRERGLRLVTLDELYAGRA